MPCCRWSDGRIFISKDKAPSSPINQSAPMSPLFLFPTEKTASASTPTLISPSSHHAPTINNIPVSVSVQPASSKSTQQLSEPLSFSQLQGPNLDNSPTSEPASGSSSCQPAQSTTGPSSDSDLLNPRLYTP